jgi:hypothetical protein
MATIPMTNSSFTPCPEGEHIFRIYNVDYNPDFGKLAIYMVNAQGFTHIERYNLMNNDKSTNDKAYSSFSYFAKTALNDFALAEIDHTDIINHYIKVEVIHTKAPSTKEPNKTVTFVNLGKEKWVADGFDTEPCKKALELGGNTSNTVKKPQEQVQNNPVDLNSLLD